MENTDSRALNSKGMTLYHAGKYSEAIECYDKVIELDPKNSHAYNNKGNALNDLGKYIEALECFDKAIEINPKLTIAFINKGLSLYDAGKYQEAVECFDQAIEVDPSKAHAYNGKGIALKNMGKYSEALECFDKAIEINPSNCNAYNDKGMTLYNLERLNDTLECFDKAIEINPKFSIAYYNKGNALNDLGKYKEAIECFDKAVEINPRFTLAYTNKGLSLYEAGKFKHAIEAFNKVIELDPRNSHAYNGNGLALYKLGKFPEALEFFNMAIELDPKNSHALNGKGNALFESGKYKEALECYDKAIEIDSKYSLTLENRRKAMKKIKEQRIASSIVNLSPKKPKTAETKPNEIKIQDRENFIQSEEINIVKPLGQGLFGTLYLAEYNFLDVVVEEIEADKERQIEETIVREVDLIKNFKHPNLVNYYGYSLHEGKIRVVREFCKGGSLFDLLHNANKSLTLKQKSKILFDAAAGLYHLHSKQPQVLHSDISSKNVLLMEDSIDATTNLTARLTDYGLSTSILEIKGKTISESETSHWMAPEVLKGEDYGEKADVYSFAILMWEVFSQKIPYSEFGFNTTVFGVKVVYGKVRPNLELLPKETPEGIINLIIKCWDDDIYQRATMKEVAGTLKSLLK